LNFGIYIPNLEEYNPSGASFEQATLRELIKANHQHRLFVFTNSAAPQKSDPRVEYVSVREFRLSGPRKFMLRLGSVVSSLGLKLYGSGKLKLLRYKCQSELATTSLNRALIAHKIRLFWHTFSVERIDIPYIYGVLDCNHWVHSYQPEFAPTAHTWTTLDLNFRQVIGQATYLVASTEMLKRQIIQIHGVPEGKVRVLPFFTPEIANVESAANDQALPDIPEVFLFYPGRLMSQKNHVTILYALKVLKEKYGLSLPLVLVGGDAGNKAYIFSKIEELGLTNDVLYLGQVSFSNLAKLYKKAFALVYASLNGPDNFPPLEAFSLGCPVIASRLEGSDEQLGDNALLFDPLDEEQLAARIFQLHGDPALRLNLIEKGYARAKSWTARDYIEGLLRIVDEFAKLSRSWDDDFLHISKKWNLLMR